MRADVVIVGAGPAGVARTIADSLIGLRVGLIDSRRPPVEKPCGEGLLQKAVSSLRTLANRQGRRNHRDLGALARQGQSGTSFRSALN
jgi:flavin-dependent dehydrogenase